MNPPWVYTCSPYWTPLPPPSLYHPSGSSQCTSPKHPVSCMEPGLVVCFTYDTIHVSMPFSQIIPHSPSSTESKRLFYTSVSLLLSCIQGYCYHLSKFHIYALVYCIDFCFIDYAKAFDCVDHNKLWEILKEMGIPDHLICLLRNLYAGQEATVRTRHGTTDWFQIGKGVRH